MPIIPYTTVDTGIPCLKPWSKKWGWEMGEWNEFRESRRSEIRRCYSKKELSAETAALGPTWHLWRLKVSVVMIGSPVSGGVWDQINFDDEENLFANNRLLGPIIGIDLGTSNSCVSLWHTVKNRAKVVKNVISKSKWSHYMMPRMWRRNSDWPSV